MGKTCLSDVEMMLNCEDLQGSLCLSLRLHVVGDGSYFIYCPKRAQITCELCFYRRVVQLQNAGINYHVGWRLNIVPVSEQETQIDMCPVKPEVTSPSAAHICAVASRLIFMSRSLCLPLPFYFPLRALSLSFSPLCPFLSVAASDQ